ncbi:cation transporter [Rhizobium sp. R72]|uniref:SLC13 family permease n=1 Tax=unclassified Rhizobium TaxID=2613769 RepID=UPI000B532D07|nr:MULTISPECIES: SLC13 family permease [unclassified Rhizobium]OWV92516.1 cation transporter [Rhizobium sp. R693]OWW01473.1 cation transporter [Rhizobium sp. R72]OWW01561.1 cation transporter [Rhizobium sp. R711]
MTFEQASLLILLLAMLILFSLERFRIEVVAIAGLLAGYALHLYSAEQVFSGFASPVVVTVVEILLIVQVLARAQLFDQLADFFVRARFSDIAVIATLSGATGFISIFMNDIGAFSIALPATLRVSDALAIPKRQLIMPISFAALLGGIVSLIGTPANMLVSNAWAEANGTGFRLFDFAYVGLPVAIVGIVMTAWLAPWLFPKTDGEALSAAPVSPPRRRITERHIPAGSLLIGARLSDLPGRFSLQPHTLVRDDKFIFGTPDKLVVEAGDLLLVEADETVFDGLQASGTLLPQRDPSAATAGPDYVEAVVMPESTLVGSRLRSLEVFSSRDVTISALSMRSPRIEGRFGDLQLSIGDILVLEGEQRAIAEALEECECLPLASQPPSRMSASSWQPFAIFAAGVATTAFDLVTPDIAFAGVVLVLALLGYLNIRQAMADLNWPIIIMLSAMIPIGSAVATTGTAQVIAAALGSMVSLTEPTVGVALVLFLSMLLTPFVNNATVAIVMSPIAVAFAATGHHSPSTYLIAVAAGASLDFLTPFGHHNNTLAMGIGSYRFSDFLKAGAPLTVLSYGLTLILVYLFWL